MRKSEPGRLVARSFATLAMLLAMMAACRSGPLFEPDPFHWALWRQVDEETRILSDRFPFETVCIRPTEPLCYCRPDERRQALAGLPRDERVDLSAATPEELTRLPGIGPELARRIVVHRKEEGFRRIVDLLEVSGIGRGRFERVRSLVRVE